MRIPFRIFLLLVCGMFITKQSVATHIYGADLYYTYIGGTTYNVNLVIYGDCAGGAFSSLPTSTPEIKVYDNNVLVQTQNLIIQNPTAGLEVTPVCPAQLSNTNCISTTGTIPGVKKFVYSKYITLGSASANWKFEFTGVMGGSAQAGRSSTISNIQSGGSSVMMLEATLNNLAFVNSSPTYTTIPTPFFCINKSANYNPGTVDPNSDSLSYALVPGLQAPSGLVTYMNSFTAASPLAVSTGSFNFNTTNGQLSFTPNMLQRSLVVYRVSEYRNGVLVGTSMREMTYVVLNNCNNNTPGGSVSNITGGTIINNTTVTVCRNTFLSFQIFPTDLDGDTINVSVSGGPSMSSFSISNNHTLAPACTFSWNVGNAAPGTYTVFVTFTDNGCPLFSKQTQAYTIIVQADPSSTFNLISPATCSKKAVFTVTQFVNGAWTAKIYQGNTLIDSITTLAAVITDSLPAGTYTLRTYNLAKCSKDTVITIASATTTLLNVSIDKPSCNKFSDGELSISASNAPAPFTFAIDNNPYVNSGLFSNLKSGSYAIHVKDAAGCIKDTTIQLTDSLKVNGAVVKSDVLCFGESNGSITVNATGGHGNYGYALNTNPSSPVNTFATLPANTYIVHTEDIQGCYWDTTITITQPALLTSNNTLTNLACNGDLSGIINFNGNGGTFPYSYSVNGGVYTNNPTYANLASGTYMLEIKDANGCSEKDTVTLTEPPAIKVVYFNIVNPRCYGDSSGFVVVTANGGTGAFTYAADQQTFNSSTTVGGLTAGAHIIRIKDANGCIKDSTVNLLQPTAIETEMAIKQATCSPLADGEIVITAAGATPPYRYAIGEGPYTTNNKFGKLKSGIYAVHVSDNVGCSVKRNVNVTDSLRINSNAAVTNVSCHGLADGKLALNPVGGTGPYIGANDSLYKNESLSFSGLIAGTYTFYIKDTIGCKADTTINIMQPQPLAIETSVSNASCYTGIPDGKILVVVKGGTEPYNYTWSTSSNIKTQEATGLTVGTYPISIADANLCKDSIDAVVEYDDCCTPYIPTAFTPNGDGKNDLFRIKVKGDMKLVAFKVYNRFGQVVFSTEDVDMGWDGTVNGTLQDIGTYYYFIKATCGNSNEHPVSLKGDITLIR